MFQPSQGSLLIICPALDLSLDSMYTASSTGQTQLQFQVTVRNNYTAALAQVEVMTIAMNSGVFETNNGFSSADTGLLNREVVLAVKNEPSVMDTGEYGEITGSGMNLHTAHPNLLKNMKHNDMLHQVQDHMMQQIKEQGSAMSG